MVNTIKMIGPTIAIIGAFERQVYKISIISDSHKHESNLTNFVIN